MKLDFNADLKHGISQEIEEIEARLFETEAKVRYGPVLQSLAGDERWQSLLVGIQKHSQAIMEQLAVVRADQMYTIAKLQGYLEALRFIVRSANPPSAEELEQLRGELPGLTRELDTRQSLLRHGT